MEKSLLYYEPAKRMADENNRPSLLTSSVDGHVEGSLSASTYCTSLVTISCQSIAQIRSMRQELIRTGMMIDPFLEDIGIIFPDQYSCRWYVMC